VSGSPGSPFAADRDERVVCHVDMDCFYAACERLKQPDLAGEPVVVGMGYEPDDDVGAVATASYEAREYGVESAQPIEGALDRLPRMADVDPEDPDAPDPADAGHYRPVDMEFYESVSGDVRRVLRAAVEGRGDPDHTRRVSERTEGYDPGDGVIRAVSIDEAYLDVSGIGWDDPDDGPDGPDGGSGMPPSVDEAGTPRSFARALKAAIECEAGVPASVGVGPNMATAKVASDHDKPDGLVVVRPGEAASFLAPLSVRELHGIGPVTARELRERGIETAGDLAAADPAELETTFGARGREIHDHARGRDDRPVTPVGEPKSLSSETATSTSDETDPRTLLRSLAAEVAERARREGAMYKTVGIKVVTPPFDVNTRARSLSGPVDEPELVERVTLELFEEFADADPRKLGVRVSNLDFSDAEQASLDGFAGTDGGDGGSAGADDGDGGSTGADRADGGTGHTDRGPRGQTRLGDF